MVMIISAAAVIKAVVTMVIIDGVEILGTSNIIMAPTALFLHLSLHTPVFVATAISVPATVTMLVAILGLNR